MSTSVGHIGDIPTFLSILLTPARKSLCHRNQNWTQFTSSNLHFSQSSSLCDIIIFILIFKTAIVIFILHEFSPRRRAYVSKTQIRYYYYYQSETGQMARGRPGLYLFALIIAGKRSFKRSVSSNNRIRRDARDAYSGATFESIALLYHQRLRTRLDVAKQTDDFAK